MINVLVTSVGGGVGQSVVDSLSQYNKRYNIIGLDISESVYARNQCSKFILSKRISEADYLDFILKICIENNIDILIPGNDGELALLSDNIMRFNAAKVEVVVSPSKIVNSSRNKYEWYKDYSDLINIVPTVQLNEYLSAPDDFTDITYPAIAKPASGSASAGIKIYLEQQEAMEDLGSEFDSADYVIQPYLFPDESEVEYKALLNAVNARKLLQTSEISCQIVYSKNSEVLGIFVSKNSLKNGVPVTIEPVTNPAIIEVLETIAHSLKSEGLVGPVNIQGRLTNKGLVFFEMNLRFTGITGNRSQFGFNEVAAVVESFVSDNHEILPTLNSNRIGARQVGCRTFYPLGQRKISKIAIVGASSWAAKNVLLYLSQHYSEGIETIYLATRDVIRLKEEVASFNLSFSNLVFVGLSEFELGRFIANVDVVLNFVSARPPCSMQDTLDATKFNLMLSRIVANSNIGLLLNMSSQSVYERNTGVLQTEQSKVVAKSEYAFAKLISEEMFSEAASKSTNTAIVNLRLSRLWGGTLPLSASQLPVKMIDSLFGKSSTTIQNGDNELNLIDIDDVSAFIIVIFEQWVSECKLPNVINLSNHNITLNSFVDDLVNVCQNQQIDTDSLVIVDKSGRDDSLVLSNELASKLGFVSRFSVQESWLKMLALYK